MKRIQVNKIENEQKKRGRKLRTSTEKYLANLEKEILNFEEIISLEKDEIPAKVEAAVREIVAERFKAKSFNGFIAQDLFSAYVEAGGRKLLTKYLKQNPKNVIALLRLIIDIGKEAQEKNLNATQININIEGLK